MSKSCLPAVSADNDTRCAAKEAIGHRVPLCRPITLGINIEVALTNLPAVSADNDTRCAAEEAIGHRVPLSALAAGIFDRTISTSIPTVGRRYHGGRTTAVGINVEIFLVQFARRRRRQGHPIRSQGRERAPDVIVCDACRQIVVSCGSPSSPR